MLFEKEISMFHLRLIGGTLIWSTYLRVEYLYRFRKLLYGNVCFPFIQNFLKIDGDIYFILKIQLSCHPVLLLICFLRLFQVSQFKKVDQE